LQQALGQRMRDEAQLAAARVTLERFETLLKQDSIARQEVDTQRATVNQLAATVVALQGQRRHGAPEPVLCPHRRAHRGPGGPAQRGRRQPGEHERHERHRGASPRCRRSTWSSPSRRTTRPSCRTTRPRSWRCKAFDRTRTELLDTGAFASLDNQIDTQTGTVRAKARFNNARQQLFPSQFVNVQLRIRTLQNAVVVPVSAVRQSGSGEYVFVLQDDRTVKLRPVVRGQPWATACRWPAACRSARR
jgi:multidrug efflux system membrane fusion protein